MPILVWNEQKTMLAVCYASYFKAFGVYWNGIQAQNIQLGKLGVRKYVVLLPFWSRILLEHVTWFLKIMVVAWILLGNETLYSIKVCLWNQGPCIEIMPRIYLKKWHDFLSKIKIKRLYRNQGACIKFYEITPWLCAPWTALLFWKQALFWKQGSISNQNRRLTIQKH